MLLVPGVRSVRAYCLTTTVDPGLNELCSSQGLGVSWQRSCISFSIVDPGLSTPPLEQLRDVADHCFATWTDVTCDGRPLALEVRQTSELAQCASPEYNQHAGNANTISFVSDWQHYEAMSPDAFGVTLVALGMETGEIYDADILINETLGPITICDGVCPRRSVDFQNVLTHEAGHFFGLGHSADPESTMSATAAIGETKKRDLDDDDRQGLCAIYQDRAASSCASSDFVPRHGFSTECASMQQMSAGGGCQVAPDRGSSRAAACNSKLLGALGMLGLLGMLGFRRRTWYISS